MFVMRTMSLCNMLSASALTCCIAVSMLIPTASANAQSSTGPLVTVAGGKVQGSLLSSPGAAVFKGIPYAQPPVGDLRWREAQSVKSWTGVRQATEYGAPCAQNDAGWNKNSAEKSSEDCLYLNVWAPEWPSQSKKAVMVWLHGGGNNGGSALGAGGIEPPFDGAKLASHGVVVVTINYRLGIFGFLGHPELTAESPHRASGTYGIQDQVAALRWVHDNIAQFGGDPGNVTLFGQSAGARDTMLVAASPLSKGLLQKAIAESGTPMSGDRHLPTPAQVEQVGVVLGQVLNAPSSGTIKYLRTLPTSQILGIQKQLVTQLQQQGLSLDVGMDGYAIPVYPADVYRSGKEVPLPMIQGNNGRDNVNERIGDPKDTPEQLLAAVKARLEKYYAANPDLLERARKLYGVSAEGSEVSKYPPYGDAAIQLGTDISQRCGAVVMSGWHSATAPTYEYEFDAGNAAHQPYHSAELDFVFGYLRDQAAEPNLAKLSDQMQQYWTNFAKTSDPNGPGLPKWPKHDSQKRAYLEFANEGIAEKSALRNVPCGIYAERLNRDLDSRKSK
jgi:para-nitrobenzyl esterase